MRKIFIDCGVREGDGIAAFLGDVNAGGGAYHRCLKPRSDSHEFEFFGFESPDYKFLDLTRLRFPNISFTLIEKLVWTFDGTVDFDSDGESCDCRLFEVSYTESQSPWRHPNPNAVVRQLPCIDLANYILQSFSRDDYLVLKLDIEGAEYAVLKRLIETGALLYFKELYIEYHWWGGASLRHEIEAFILQHSEIFYRNDWP